MTPYVSLAEAEAYFDERLHANAWLLATTTDKLRALKMATRDIDRLDFANQKTDDSQEHEFPREDAETVPEDIKVACCEIALSRLQGIDPEQEREDALVTSQSVAGVRATYDRDSVPEHKLAGIASAAAWAYLRPFLREPGNVTISRVS